MSTWGELAGLPVEIDELALDGRELAFGDVFTRATTRVLLRGGGEEGVGEDVVYDAGEHAAFQAHGGGLPVTGGWTLESLAARLDELDLFPGAPPAGGEASRAFRRWAFESAALDLALRQAGRALHDVLGREPRPVAFVVSMRLGPLDGRGPESARRVHRLLRDYPGTRLKLDPTIAWTQELCDELRAVATVDTLDFKAHYRHMPVAGASDPRLYRMVAETFEDAWLEDPALNDETRAVLEPHADRITWDGPIRSVADLEALPRPPRAVNMKPSRFGTLRALFDAYDHCRREGIDTYGGGQTELAEGRGQVQYLASLFHPEMPNDTAPGGYNMPRLVDGLPRSPLAPAPAPVGFRWGEPVATGAGNPAHMGT